MKIKGFTLIELMMVVVIIGILAAIVIPVLKHYGNKNSDEHFRDVPTNGHVVPDKPITTGIATKCEKVSDSADGVVYKCPDGTVLLVK